MTLYFILPIGTFCNPYARFIHMHTDIVGPLPSCQGYSYILTIVDRFLRWQLKTSLGQLDCILLSINNIVKEDLSCTPAEIVFGTSLSLPGQFFGDDMHSNLTSYFLQESKGCRNYNSHLFEIQPNTCTHQQICIAASTFSYEKTQLKKKHFQQIIRIQSFKQIRQIFYHIKRE